MGLQRRIYLIAEIGNHVRLKHPKRGGIVSGTIQDITCRLKDKDYTYHVLTRTKEGKPFTLLAKKDNLIEVEGMELVKREAFHERNHRNKGSA